MNIMKLSLPVELVAKMTALPKLAIVAISGYGGSGKSTLAVALQNALPQTTIIHMDDFIVKEKLLEPTWETGVFDRDRLKNQVLKPLREGKAARYQKLLWFSNTLSDFIKVPKSEIVIVEGISSYHPDLAKYYDFKIWVKTPIQIAKKRGHARDGANDNANHWDLWAENDLAYEKEYQPEQSADYVFINE